jgi:type II secretory pathway component PulK
LIRDQSWSQDDPDADTEKALRAAAWVPDGEARPWRFGGHSLEIAIQAEAGLVDLNAAEGAVVEAVLEEAGIDSTTAASLAASVLDWRDADSARIPGGAEERDYRAAGLPYGPANDAFQDVAELRLVIGMTPEVYALVKPFFTVETGAASPSLELAPSLVKEAVQSAGASAAELGDTKAAELVRAFARRASGLGAGVAFGGGSSEEQARRNALRIHVVLDLDDGKRYQGVATVAPDSAGRGLRIIRWHNLGFVSAGPGASG